MNVKHFFLLIALSATVMITSCTNDDIIDNSPTAVKFTSAVAGQNAQPMTKAAGTTWGNDDAIGIYMVATGTTTISEGAGNRKYTTSGGNTFTNATAADAIYYPVNEDKVDFIAYYPQTAGLVNFVYNVNVGTQSSQAAIDLLYSNNATNKDKTSTSVALTFNHKLVKLILNTTAGAGLQTSDLTSMGVSIKGMNTKNTFNLKTGALGTSNSPATITPYTATNGAKYEAIVLPCTVTNLGDVSVEFTIGGDTFVWKVPAGKTFISGEEHTYNITITRTGVSVTGNINPWTQLPSVPGTAE